MSKKCYKRWIVSSLTAAIIGIICFIVKIVESTMRTEHEWAQTFLILGFVFVGLALVLLILASIFNAVGEAKKSKNSNGSEEEILAKYKSKNK